MTKLSDYLLALAADASPDGAADYVMTYDDSASAMKKVLLDDLPSAGGGGGGAADYVQSAYTAAPINLGTSTDGSFVDADATNAKITFTPASAGKYRVTFTFSHYIKAAVLDMYLRLTDGTTSSTPQECFADAAVSADRNEITTLSFIFNWTAAAHTVKLQKRVTTATTVTANTVAAASGNGEGLAMSVERIGS